MKITLQERLESLKAGTIAAIAFSGWWTISLLYHQFLDYGTLPSPLFSAGSVLLSGFLFGVTYRYIVRNDDNSHLRDGAVLAFTLVRVGGYGSGIDHILDQNLLLLIFLGESLIGFAVARSSLDFALVQQWLTPPSVD